MKRTSKGKSGVRESGLPAKIKNTGEKKETTRGAFGRGPSKQLKHARGEENTNPNNRKERVWGVQSERKTTPRDEENREKGN